MPRVAIALGSNLGDRETNLRLAIEALRSISTKNQPFLQASLYDTEPQNCPIDSPRFLNTVVEFHYPKEDPFALLEETQKIESCLGRIKNPIRNAPRIIDVDILLFGETVLRTDQLELPHPRIHERAFVLNPLREVRPGF